MSVLETDTRLKRTAAVVFTGPLNPSIPSRPSLKPVFRNTRVALVMPSIDQLLAPARFLTKAPIHAGSASADSASAMPPGRRIVTAVCGATAFMSAALGASTSSPRSGSRTRSGLVKTRMKPKGSRDDIYNEPPPSQRIASIGGRSWAGATEESSTCVRVVPKSRPMPSRSVPGIVEFRHTARGHAHACNHHRRKHSVAAMASPQAVPLERPSWPPAPRQMAEFALYN